MVQVNNFIFAAYDVGGNGATKGDGKLTGEEIYKAAQDGWTVWDGFQNNDKAMRTDAAIDNLFNQARANNNPSLTDQRRDADSDYLSWAMGRFDTEGVSEVITREDTTILKKTYTSPVGKQGNIKWIKVTDTYIIKNNDDGTTDITYQGWDGQFSRILIDNRAGKEMVTVNNGIEYCLDDKTTGKRSFKKLGDFVKNMMGAPNREIKRVPNPLIEGKHFESIDITF